MTEPTDLGYGRGGQTLFVVVPALIGAALGWGLWALLDWLLGLPWIPFRGPLALVDSIPDQVALPRDEGGKQYWRRTDRSVEP